MKPLPAIKPGVEEWASVIWSPRPQPQPHACPEPAEGQHNFESNMIEKHIGEDHKGANCVACAAAKTLVFQSRRVAPQRTKRRFLALSSMFAHPGTPGRAKSFGENNLTIGPRAQTAYQNSSVAGLYEAGPIALQP